MRKNRPVITSIGRRGTRLAYIKYFDSGDIKIYLTDEDYAEDKNYKTFDANSIEEFMYELEDLTRMKYVFRVWCE